ncbi:MAG TPA: NAD(P)/FAD-dependent oxidoreductase [Eubacteriales bacterium]|nr:NAD(P)/FAD-dependent oxidoreductase [Eubacteriales bacterium]
MDNRFDVIVVGAGNAGLVAAATAAKNGLNTLLLEKHNLPGGCATSFCRGRFEFEPSLHELASVGTKEHPDSVYKIFDGLGAKVDWRYEHNMFRAIVKGKDGYDVTLKSGVETFCDSMEQAVPGCRASVRALFDLVQKCNEALAYITKMKGKPNGLTMMLKHGDFMRTASHSAEDVMNALGMPEKARDIICTYWGYLGVPTDELNALHFLNMLNCYVVDGAAMPYKRSHELSLSLADVILGSGGQIWYNSEVTKFLYDAQGAVCGVVANGRELYAKEVISNVIPHNVFNMSDADKIPQTDLKLANAREFGISVATVYLGMDCTMEELGIDDYTVFVMSDANPRRQYENRDKDGIYIVNCLNKVIPDSSPKGTCTLFFTIPIFGSDLPDDLTPEGYKKYKNEIARKYIADYEKLMGLSILPHIEEISVATPVTFARYLGTPEGTIYGYKLSGWDNLLARISCEKDEYTIPGLSFCGGHATRGDGYSSAYVTGDAVAKRVVKRMKEAN